MKLEPGIYGLTGGAGSGKSTLANKLAAELGANVYSIDWRFIGDSASRKRMLAFKQSKSFDALRDACDQSNWWDWNEIESDLNRIAGGEPFDIPNCYDRQSGTQSATLRVGTGLTWIVEGASLGGAPILSKLSKIFLMTIDPTVRLNRMVAKDAGRRSIHEILARFLITEYSESVYYSYLLREFGDKVETVDQDLEPIMFSQACGKQFIPVEI